MSEGIVTFLASFAVWLLFAGIVVLWLIDGRIKKETAVHALASALVAWVLAEMIKSLIPSLRPFEINGLSPLTLTVPSGAAFPSGHTAVSFGLATAVWLHNKKIGLAFVIGALGVGLGRVLGNVHSLGDVFGGGALGVIVSLVLGKIHFFKVVAGEK
jgi:undecaprenyl-diphosphatase